jgi:hypothetical protein
VARSVRVGRIYSRYSTLQHVTATEGVTLARSSLHTLQGVTLESLRYITLQGATLTKSALHYVTGRYLGKVFVLARVGGDMEEARRVNALIGVNRTRLLGHVATELVRACRGIL